MKKVWQSDDGKIFETEDMCQAHENRNNILKFIELNCDATWDDDAGYEIITVENVADFITNHITEIDSLVQ